MTSTARTPTALERCTGDADGFLRESFGVAPRRHHAGSFDDLLTLADVDEALTGRGLRRPAVRVVRDGDVVDPTRWTRRARTGAVTVDDVVDPARTLELFADGCTIVLQSLQRWWPPVAAFCRELERSLTHAVQANAYLTPGGAVGLAPHHDTHNVFVLQLHGTKHWTIRDAVVEAPLRRHRTTAAVAGSQPVRFEAELHPGSCLYLPRGVVHSARAQEGVSLHLTIGVLATTAHDVIERLAALAADEPSLRRDLPAGWASDPTAATEAIARVLDDFASFASGVDAGAIADDLAGRYAATRQPLLSGHLLDLARLDEVDDTTVVRPRRGVVWRAWREGERFVVRVADRRVDLPAAVEVAVRRLLDGPATCVVDLGDVLDGPGRAVLVRRFVREGLVEIVDVATVRGPTGIASDGDEAGRADG